MTRCAFHDWGLSIWGSKVSLLPIFPLFHSFSTLPVNLSASSYNKWVKNNNKTSSQKHSWKTVISYSTLETKNMDVELYEEWKWKERKRESMKDAKFTGGQTCQVSFLSSWEKEMNQKSRFQPADCDLRSRVCPPATFESCQGLETRGGGWRKGKGRILRNV